ncbi:MAG: hypothetical protein Q4E17_00010 [Synergistes sp.]|nr:hypothetical protein [Synergistes sp.]
MKTKKIIKAYTSLFLCAFFLFSCTSVGLAAQTKAKTLHEEYYTLSAYDLKYNTKTGDAFANGNVIIRQRDSVLKCDTAQGNTTKGFMSAYGNVRGTFPQHNAAISADKAIWKKGSAGTVGSGMIEATGNAVVTRGAKDRISAEKLHWDIGTDNYQAQGNVDGIFEGKILKADIAKRYNNRFWAKGVKRYEDTKEKYSFSSKTLEGLFRKNPKTGELTLAELVAGQAVTFRYADREGLITVITGKKAIYSKARGTIVISGGTKAVRSDGKTVMADTMVVYEDSRVVEAKGNSKIIFEVKEEKNKEQNEDGRKANYSAPTVSDKPLEEKASPNVKRKAPETAAITSQDRSWVEE